MLQPSDEVVNDDDRPSNTLELFVELDEVCAMIKNLSMIHDDGFEKNYEKYSEILGRYQEQPHLLDPHINRLIDELLIYIRDVNSPETLYHGAFKYLYQLSNVRTYKVLVKFLPHELTDLEFVLVALEKQIITDLQNWETRYMLILWMSILVLNPFHLSRLDAFQQQPANHHNNEEGINHVGEIPKMERIYQICLANCQINDTCSMVAAFLCSKYLIRIDVKESYLKKFFDLVAENHNAETENPKFGQLAAVAAILKHGKREDLLPYAKFLLAWILGCDYKKSTDFLKYKYYIKIIQRLGLVLLKPKIAAWRYQRGSRSLTANLVSAQNQNNDNRISDVADDEDEDDTMVPEEIEDVIEELLQALRSSSSDIRWLSAKGVGRVTNRLPKAMGDEVVGSVIEIFNPLEPHEAWHGACLAIAEWAKRGLLLPYRLTTMVPHLLEALVYDEMKGYMSVGQHIRDSACYMSWAFARAYNPADLQPFVEEIAAGLLVTTVFDREINCRRAASAAFQENVGRLGNFPHGIDILTTADFYSVGLRSHSYLEISDYIAQFSEYTNPLIDHLVERKVNHWDTAIRDLTAKTFAVLTKRAPDYMAKTILLTLFEKTNSIDINTRHGSVLAIGEIIRALSKLEEEENVRGKYIGSNIIEKTDSLVGTFIKRDQFRGISGEMMKQACCDFIRNASLAKIGVTETCIESWQSIVDKCFVNKSSQIRKSAISALTELCQSYYDNAKYQNKNTELIEFYLKGCENDLEEHIRMGYISVIGSLPKFMLILKFAEILRILIRQSLVPGVGALRISGSIENPVVANWSEARRDSVKSLSKFIQTIGFATSDEISISKGDNLDRIFVCLLKALEEYTKDNRGDIGAWVREASMNALFTILTTCPHGLLKADVVHQIMGGLAQQAVEKIDRTRGLAGKLFCNLIHSKPAIPHIKQHDTLKNIFPEDSSKVLWLFADHTFPMFCSMLALPEYSERLILGLSASIGQLTESLIKYSSAAMFQYLKAHPNDIERIGNEIISVFNENMASDRITHPMLNFLDLLLSSGTFNTLLSDEESKFADDLFRSVILEMKGNKKLYKLVSSINVLCQLIQVPKLCTKIFSKLVVFLGQPHVHIRKSTATKLYEALTLYGDTSGLSDENLDEVLTILSETDWGMSIADVRIIRNNLCTLMGVKPPVSIVPQ